MSTHDRVQEDPLEIDEGLAQQRLLTWFSSSFPIGSFAYSSGLETAITKEKVTNACDLKNWVKGLLQHGSIHSDSTFCAVAWTSVASDCEFEQLTVAFDAMTASPERLRESYNLGRAFADSLSPWTRETETTFSTSAPYPVVVGRSLGVLGVDQHDSVLAFTNSQVTNLVQIAMRLGTIGQSDGLEVLYSLERDVLTAVQRACRGSISGLRQSSISSDIFSMQHESQTVRIFQS